MNFILDKNNRDEKVIYKEPETTAGKKLTHVCTITLPGEAVTTFCLQSIDEYLIVHSKALVDVMKFEKAPGNHLGKLQLISSSFPPSSYSVVEKLTVNQKRVFTSANMQEKNDIMLDPVLFPDCAVSKNYQFVKCRLSPYSSGNELFPAILARLSFHGSLDLATHSRDIDTNELHLEVFAELCEIRKKSFSLNPYTKLEKLQEIINELTFSQFDWCPEIFESYRLLVAVTKSNEMIIYAVNTEKQVHEIHNEKLEGVVGFVKWIISKETHFVIVTNSKGISIRYKLKIGKDTKTFALEKVDTFEGKIKAPISNIQAESIKDDIVLVCSKAHSLEVFLITKSSISMITKYVGLNITGLVNIGQSKLEYLISTLNNQIFYMRLSIKNNEVSIVSYEKVENSLTDPENNSSKYAAYGLAASSNKVLVFIAIYPLSVSFLYSNRT